VAELARSRQQVERGQEIPEMVRRLKHWQKDPDFSGVRDQASLKTLPAEQAKQWREFWGDVQSTLIRAEQKKQ